MNTKIRVEYDFDKKEPYLQFQLNVKSDESVDLRDQMLRSFCDNARNWPVLLIEQDVTFDTQFPELRILNGIDPRQLSRMAILFEEWSKAYFYNVVGDEKANQLAKTHTEFFKHLRICFGIEKTVHSAPVENKKTFRDIFELELPDDARLKAFQNTPKYKWDYEANNSIYKSLEEAFDWDKSPEGRKYWEEVSKSLL